MFLFSFVFLYPGNFHTSNKEQWYCLLYSFLDSLEILEILTKTDRKI